MNQEPMFQVGDKVKAFGIEGMVERKDDKDVRIRVVFTNGEINWFRIDGKLAPWHLEPSLHLVERAKKKMRIEAWANVYSDNAFVVHDTKEIADSFGKNKIERIACVKLTSEEFEI